MREDSFSTIPFGRVFYRPRDIAEITGISIPQVYVEIRNGNLKASKLGTKSIVITPDDFQAWIDSSITPITTTSEV